MIQPITLSVCARCVNRSTRSYSKEDEAPLVGQGLCESCCKTAKVRIPVRYNAGWFNDEGITRKIKGMKNRKIKAKNLIAFLVAARENGHKVVGEFNNIVEISKTSDFSVKAGSEVDEYSALMSQTKLLSELCQYHGVAIVTSLQNTPKTDTLRISRSTQLRRVFKGQFVAPHRCNTYKDQL